MSDLQDLWQSAAPDIDTDALIERLQRQNRALRRVNRISFAVSGLSILAIFALEFIGRLPTQGLLSALGLAGFAWAVWKYRRNKARLIAAYSEDVVRLLPFLIGRTRAARNLGLYFLITPVPSILLGFGIGYFTDDGAAPEPNLAAIGWMLPPLFLLFGGLMAYGYGLARRKSAELRELEAMQRELEE
ncbi:MAG: hypothetical protein WBG08_03255 [Litorimonas sp.]